MKTGFGLFTVAIVIVVETAYILISHFWSHQEALDFLAVAALAWAILQTMFAISQAYDSSETTILLGEIRDLLKRD